MDGGMSMSLNEAEGKLERIEKQIRTLLLESKDRYFTEYLQKLSQRVLDQKYQADLLQDELDRSYQMYQNRMKLMEEKESFPNADLSWEEPVVQPAAQLGSVEENYTQAVMREAPSPQPRQKNDAEFTVGAVLLSILGGVFILIALVMLGVNYMNGFIKGMCLYGIAASVLFVSEIFLYRRWNVLGSTLSAIGIGGLYLSTVINYLSLHNFPGWTAMLITAGITFFVILLSRKRDSAIYRILGLIACYLCFVPIGKGISDSEFLAVTGMILLINIMCAVFPIQKYSSAINILHMISNVLFAQLFIWRAAWCNVPTVPRMIFLFTSLTIMQLLFVIQVRGQKRGEGIQAAYCISAVLYLSMFYFELDTYNGAGLIGYYGSLLGMLAICLITFLFLLKYKEKWYVYTLLNLNVMMIAKFIGTPQRVILWLVLLLAVKLFSLKKQPATLLKINDVLLTAVICMGAIAYRSEINSKEDLVCAALLLAGVLFSIAFIRYWQTFFELALTYTVAIFVAISVPPMLKLPMFAAILLVGILLFNSVERWKGKNILLFNALALSGQIVCFLFLARPVYRNAYITYLCMLIFGLATIVITFQDRYHMNFRSKAMITAVFFTYMALIVKINPPVINSILLMLIALVSVAAGFAEKKKGVRIYGLVLSLLVCGKIVSYDFMGAPTLQKTLLFFVVGVIALMIAGIYIILEKRNEENE